MVLQPEGSHLFLKHITQMTLSNNYKHDVGPFLYKDMRGIEEICNAFLLYQGANCSNYNFTLSRQSAFDILINLSLNRLYPIWYYGYPVISEVIGSPNYFSLLYAYRNQPVGHPA